MRISQIAERYGIPFEYVQKIPERNRLTELSRYGCDPHRRVIYVLKELEGKPEQDLPGREFLFHELVHCIVHPPGSDIDRVHEGWVLLQFERALAVAAFQDDEDVLSEILDYQNDTTVDYWEGSFHITCLYQCDDRPERFQFWQDGVARCQLFGLLDTDGQPTWKLPLWTKKDCDALDLKDNMYPAYLQAA